MTVPPNNSGRDHSDAPNHAALPQGGANREEGPRVVDVEILNNHENTDNNARGAGQRKRGPQCNGWGDASSFGPFGEGSGMGAGGHGSGREQFRGRFFYRGTFGQPGGMGGINFGRVWMGGNEQNGCLAPCITFALFMVCLAQFGFLAGIGFIFFHIVGAIMGVMRDLRQFSAGRLPNPWPWRIGNWAISFLLTAWFAGAFH